MGLGPGGDIVRETLKDFAEDLSSALDVVAAIERFTLPLVWVLVIIVGVLLVWIGSLVPGLLFAAVGSLGLYASLRFRSESGG